MNQKVRLLISYDGTDFGGWQRQKVGRPTVQGTIEQALSQLFDEPVGILGAGRTDAGVHAIGQVAHFTAPKDPSKYNLIRSLNSLTPDSIGIKSVALAPDDFHSIASARAKTYKYLIVNSSTPSALRSRYSTWVRKPLDLNLLNSYSKFLVKKQDFKSFQTSGTEVNTTIRQVFHARWKACDNDLVEFSIRGDGFLKQMVRNIVGTQLNLLQCGAQPEQMAAILAAKDRRSAGGTAPPQGLYLYHIEYPRDLDNKCRKI